jgi:hypothetical protein
LLFTDLALFSRKLADRLAFYNAGRPHHTLGQRSPLSFLRQHQPECQRYWTHTPSCHGVGLTVDLTWPLKKCWVFWGSSSTARCRGLLLTQGHLESSRRTTQTTHSYDARTTGKQPPEAH